MPEMLKIALLLAAIVAVGLVLFTLRKLAEGDRIDDAETLAARERLFDGIEREHWKREGRRLRNSLKRRNQ